jgi:hypothetical protein
MLNELTIGCFYIAYVALGTKIRRIEGALEHIDDMTITLAPSPTPLVAAPVKVRVYKEQIVRID